MYIVKCGNRTPLGERAGTTATGVRAGFSMISLNREYEDSNWEPIRLGLAEYIHKQKPIEDQFNELALPALTETLSFFEENGINPGTLTVIVGLPETRPGISEQLKQWVTAHLMKSTEKAPGNIVFKTEATGHTAALKAIESATGEVEQHEFCIVGGVDSYHDRSTIRWLEKEVQRLFTSANKEGFVPGQAAGFVLLASESAIEKYKITPLAKIHSCIFSDEEADFASGIAPTGKAMTRCMKKVSESLPEDLKIDAIYSAMNGERYHAVEMAYAVANLGPKLKNVGNIIAPYVCWGDLGAAIVPVLLGLMTEAGKKGYAKGPLNLVTAANLGNQRAGALIELLNIE